MELGKKEISIFAKFFCIGKTYSNLEGKAKLHFFEILIDTLKIIKKLYSLKTYFKLSLTDLLI
jgi:hypothetical protein